MGLKLRITGKSLKDHFRYYALAYILAIVFSATFFDTGITMINEKAAPEYKLASYICGDYINASYYYVFLEEMTKAFPDMKVVACENLAYNTNNTMASTYKQKFLSMISNSYGDVMIIPYNEFADLVRYGAFAPLEDVLGDYLKNISPESLKTVDMRIADDDTSHIFAIPLDRYEFFPYTYDTSDKVLIITSYTQNYDNAVELAKWYLDYMIETEWWSTTTTVN